MVRRAAHRCGYRLAKLAKFCPRNVFQTLEPARNVLDGEIVKAQVPSELGPVELTDFIDYASG